MATAPTVVTVSSGYFSAETMNANFTTLADAFEDVLSLSGTTPNSMSADLDMNSNDVLNVGAISADSLVLAGSLVTLQGLAIADDAVSVGVTDAGGYFSGVNVETVLQELGEYNDAITVTAIELNYTDGVTSNIQTQLDDKAPIDSAALTGAPTAPTAAAATDTTQIATTAFVNTAVSTAIDAGPQWMELIDTIVVEDNLVGGVLTSAEFTVDSTKYKHLMCRFNNVRQDTDGAGYLNFDLSSGGVYNSGTFSSTQSVLTRVGAAVNYTDNYFTSGTGQALNATNNMGNTTGEGGHGTININSIDSTTEDKGFDYTMSYRNATFPDFTQVRGAGWYDETDAIDGFRLFSFGTSGLIAGTISLYGLRG